MDRILTRIGRVARIQAQSGHGVRKSLRRARFIPRTKSGKTCNTITGNARNAETRSLKLASLLQPAEGRPSSSIFKTRSSLPLPVHGASTQKSIKPTQVLLVTFWISSGTKGLRVGRATRGFATVKRVRAARSLRLKIKHRSRPQ